MNNVFMIEKDYPKLNVLYALTAAAEFLACEAGIAVNPIGCDEILFAHNRHYTENGGVNLCNIGNAAVRYEIRVDDDSLAPSLADSTADAACHSDA